MNKPTNVSSLSREYLDRKVFFADLVPYTSDMKTTKNFLYATLDMILRYIAEMNEHDSPVSDK